MKEAFNKVSQQLKEYKFEPTQAELRYVGDRVAMHLAGLKIAVAMFGDLGAEPSVNWKEFTQNMIITLKQRRTKEFLSTISEIHEVLKGDNNEDNNRSDKLSIVLEANGEEDRDSKIDNA